MAPDEVCESREADGSAQDTAKSENPRPAMTGLGPWQIVVWLALGLAIVVPLTALVSESLFRTVFWVVVGAGVIIVAISVSCLSVLSVAFRYHGAARQIVVWLAVGMGIVVAMATLLSDSQFPSVFWGMAILAFPGTLLSEAFRYHGARRRIELVVGAVVSLGMLTVISLGTPLSIPMFLLISGMTLGLNIVKDIVVLRWYPETPKD